MNYPLPIFSLPNYTCICCFFTGYNNDIEGQWGQATTPSVCNMLRHVAGLGLEMGLVLDVGAGHGRTAFPFAVPLSTTAGNESYSPPHPYKYLIFFFNQLENDSFPRVVFGELNRSRVDFTRDICMRLLETKWKRIARKCVLSQCDALTLESLHNVKTVHIFTKVILFCVHIFTKVILFCVHVKAFPAEVMEHMVKLIKESPNVAYVIISGWFFFVWYLLSL